MKRLLQPLIIYLFIAGCGTTIYPVTVYQQGGPRMVGEMAGDWSGAGEIRFVHQDGERFTGHYTTIAYEEYHVGVGALFGVGRTAGVGVYCRR